jgi:polyhydroxyalkanoate synthesis regulator phasin
MRDIKTAYADDPATQIADAKADLNGRMQAVKAQIDALTTRVAALESKVGP